MKASTTWHSSKELKIDLDDAAERRFLQAIKTAPVPPPLPKLRTTNAQVKEKLDTFNECFTRGLWEEAVSAGIFLVKLAVFDVEELFARLAYAASLDGQYELSVSYASQSIKIYPHDGYAYLAYANIACANGMARLARSWISIAAATPKTNPTALKYLQEKVHYILAAGTTSLIAY